MGERLSNNQSGSSFNEKDFVKNTTGSDYKVYSYSVKTGKYKTDTEVNEAIKKYENIEL